MKTKILALTLLFSTMIFFSFKIEGTKKDTSNALINSTKPKAPKVEIGRIYGDPIRMGNLVGCPTSQRTCIIKYDDGSNQIQWIAMGELQPEERFGHVVLEYTEEGIDYYGFH